MTEYYPDETAELLIRASLEVRRRIEREALAGAGLQWTSWRILQLLHDTDALETQEVARRTGITKPTLTGLQGTLAGRGLLERVIVPTDARRAWLRITPAGRQVVQATERGVSHAAEGWLRSLNNAEIRQLTALLRAVVPTP